MSEETRMYPVDFVTAAPGWRLWIVWVDGVPHEVALAGWVTLAETVLEVDQWGEDLGHRRTGFRSIHPGWISDGEVITTQSLDGDGSDVWPVGPGDQVPTADQLAEWGERHRKFHESIKEERQKRLAESGSDQ
jgi:hypothetical protein